MNQETKTVYYSDPLHDEFSTAQITPRPIDGSWQYLPKGPWKAFTHFFWYRVVATPLGKAFLALKFHHKMVGREKLPKQGGYFLFGNHTQEVADALIPTMLAFPKDVYVVVHPNNVSMPFLGRITPSLGALPLPDGLEGSRNFLEALHTRLCQGNALCIYPEAHIWPYYTDIRPFSDASFGYALKENAPVYCFTNTYQKRGKGVQIVTYVDGPFLPDNSLPRIQKRKDLRDRVYEAMRARSKLSNVQVIRYVRRDAP